MRFSESGPGRIKSPSPEMAEVAVPFSDSVSTQRQSYVIVAHFPTSNKGAFEDFIHYYAACQYSIMKREHHT